MRLAEPTVSCAPCLLPSGARYGADRAVSPTDGLDFSRPSAETSVGITVSIGLFNEPALTHQRCQRGVVSAELARTARLAARTYIEAVGDGGSCGQRAAGPVVHPARIVPAIIEIVLGDLAYASWAASSRASVLPALQE